MLPIRLLTGFFSFFVRAFSLARFRLSLAGNGFYLTKKNALFTEERYFKRVKCTARDVATCK